MLSHDEMVGVVDAYIAAFDAGDPDAILELFAPDATVEDPAGSDTHRGLEAIRAFYTAAMKSVARLELDGQVRTANGAALFAFHVYLTRQTPQMRVAVIDMFRFADSGKIQSMEAYFNERNFTVLTDGAVTA